jgi:hypothetical protein
MTRLNSYERRVEDTAEKMQAAAQADPAFAEALEAVQRDVRAQQHGVGLVLTQVPDTSLRRFLVVADTLRKSSYVTMFGRCVLAKLGGTPLGDSVH